MRRKGIIHLNHKFPSISETFTYAEVVALIKLGVPLYVMAFKRPPEEEQRIYTEDVLSSIRKTTYFPPLISLKTLWTQFSFFVRYPVKYLSLLVKTIKSPYVRFSNLRLRFQSFVDFLRGVVVASYAEKMGALHIHSQFSISTATSAWVACKLLGITFSFRNCTRFNPQMISDKIRDAKFVIACCQSDKDLLLSWSDRQYADKIFVDLLGIDVDEWKPVSVEEEKDVIVCISRLTDTKGQEVLLKAASLMRESFPDLRIWLVGGGPERGRLEKLEHDLSISNMVEFTGPVTDKELRGRLARASLFCLPCVYSLDGNYDGIPVSLMEAMAYGKACVSTSISGIPELIDSGHNGELVATGDAKELAFTLSHLLRDGELRAKYGKAAREKIVRDFNIRKNIPKVTRLFFKAAGIDRK